MKRLVLVGAGHAHALLLRDWATRGRLSGTELVLVTPAELAPYSGMVPGWLAGTYRHEQICVDFRAPAAAAGARLVHDELAALDTQRAKVTLASGAELDYDWLSLNVGSTLEPPPGPRVLALRPLGRLRSAWEALLADTDTLRGLDTVTAVGGGAAAFEALLAVLRRLRLSNPALQGRLVAAGDALLPGLAESAARRARQALDRAGVAVRLNTEWHAGLRRDNELLLWATGAMAHGWQRDEARRGGLEVSDRGFIRVDSRLRSVSHPQVFAAGDCAEWSPPLPKAGVHAVRMAPVLAHNLRAALGGGVMRPHEPQRHFLALLSTADGRAIAARGGWSAEGRWLWRWKDHIDRAFLRRCNTNAA